MTLPADLLVCSYDDTLSAALADRTPAQVVIDLGASELTDRDILALSAQHRAWRAAGWSTAYAASRSSTRGAVVVALHRAGDHDTTVSPSVAQAAASLDQGQRRLQDALNRLGVTNVIPTARASTWQTRSLAAGFNWLGSLQNGYKTPFIETMLRTYGVSAMPQLAPALQGALDALTEAHGERHAQAVVAFAALGNGCPFCSYGHLYAADLLHFEETGTLCPISPEAMLEARGWLDAEITGWITTSLTGPIWGPIAATVLRQRELRGGAAARSPMDETLLQVTAAWQLISECSLQHEITNAPPLHPRMARARRLQRAYRAARAARAA